MTDHSKLDPFPFLKPLKLVRQTCGDVSKELQKLREMHHKQICNQAVANIENLRKTAHDSANLFFQEKCNPNLLHVDHLRKSCLIAFLNLKDCIDSIEMSSTHINNTAENAEYIKNIQRIVQLYRFFYNDLNEYYDKILTCLISQTT